MNRGLMRKAALELWPATLLLGAGLLAAQCVLSYVLPRFQVHFANQLMYLPMAQAVIRAMLGTEVHGALGPDIFMSIAWVHPVVLAIIWAHATICCTRVPAGEVDRGTIDLLLGLPVSRSGLFVTETIAWIGSAMVLLMLGLAGNLIGTHLAKMPQLGAIQLARIMANLLLMYLAVGGFAWLTSSLSDRRGRAMTIVFAAVLVSFLINYLSQFWEPAQQVQFLSVLQYYRPLLIMRGDAWPLNDMLVLGAVTALLWLAAGTIFMRRDLAAL